MKRRHFISSLFAIGLSRNATRSAADAITRHDFTKGGVYLGPTIGLIGNVNQQGNPEVVAPLSMLRDMINKQPLAL